MIKHVVMWRVSDNYQGKNKKQAALFLKDQLESMIGNIDGLLTLEVGINAAEGDQACDLVLITTHPTMADLAAYQVHPMHVAVAAHVKAATTQRVFVDFAI